MGVRVGVGIRDGVPVRGGIMGIVRDRIGGMGVGMRMGVGMVGSIRVTIIRIISTITRIIIIGLGLGIIRVRVSINSIAIRIPSTPINNRDSSKLRLKSRSHLPRRLLNNNRLRHRLLMSRLQVRGVVRRIRRSAVC